MNAGPPRRCVTCGDPVILCSHADLHAEVERLRAALRQACDDAFADGEGAMRGYLDASSCPPHEAPNSASFRQDGGHGDI